ncbi:hypothetical protein HDU87_000291 [Geranomyces variabilis]|uniref:Uncharacterized protein n=1 Tax=Geranomyces variabilis TaxID=109894 RepID=A0AAD5XU92_9FUNG|nr:hypothetical protein HDU87_000291 [Geranomyces variabilis]
MSQKLRKAVDSLLKQTSKKSSIRRTNLSSSSKSAKPSLLATPAPSSSATSSSSTSTSTTSIPVTTPKRIRKAVPNRVNFRKNERAAQRQRELALAKRKQLEELRNGASGVVEADDDSERIRKNVVYFLGGKTSERTKEVMQKLKGMSK